MQVYFVLQKSFCRQVAILELETLLSLLSILVNTVVSPVRAVLYIVGPQLGSLRRQEYNGTLNYQLCGTSPFNLLTISSYAWVTKTHNRNPLTRCANI